MLSCMTTTHHAEFDWAAQLTRLELGEELHQPFFEQAAAWLRELRHPARTDRILDVGSGAGVVTAVLAHAFPAVELVAVDATPALLDAVTARAERLGIADRVHVMQASLPEDAATLPDADLIWASDALHHVGDQQAAIDLLHARLRQDGLLAVCEGGLPARFLPNEIGFGRPGLQSRLDAVTADGFAAMRAGLPNATPAVDDWPGMLRASGFEAVASRTFLVDVPAPLPARARAYLTTNLAAQRDGLAEHLDATDLEAIARLLDDADPAGLFRRSDVFFLNARTVHTGGRGSTHFRSP
jgi:SAM-dependent methyltransferase